MADKASVQAKLTIAETDLTNLKKQENMATSNGPDGERITLAALVVSMAALRTEVDALV